ncbi:hypothetical protein MTO96_039367, partial [Rhipicephalus appendiculatus]
MTPFQKTSPEQRSPLQEPPPLSAAWLAQRLLTSNQDNNTADDDDGIIVRVQREYKNVSPTASSQSKPPQRRHDRPFLPASSSSSRTCETRRKGEGRENRNDGGNTFSLPIEWGGTRHTDETGDEATSSNEPSSLPFYSPGDVEEASSLALLSSEVQDSLPPPASLAASQDTDSASFLAQRNCIRLGSLKTETRWLSQSVAPASSRASLASTQRQQRQKSAPPLSSSNPSPVPPGIHDSSGAKE